MAVINDITIYLNWLEIGENVMRERRNRNGKK
jgi:hypothetical protein